MNKNKYLVLIGVLLAQLTIAALYAWSILSVAIIKETSWTENEVLIAYFIAQFVFAFSTIFSGRLVDQKGPRFTLIIGGLLYGGGLVLSSFASTPFMLYITYGVLSGAGVGFVYVCPLTTLIKWFPHHKGAITGLSVAVFGGGSILFKEIISMLLKNYNVSHTFLVLGITSFLVIIIGAIFVGFPDGYKNEYAIKTEKDYSTSEMIKTNKFKKIWMMFYLAVIPGLLVLGAAKNIGLSANLSYVAAASLISILALSNATSRLISGALSDRFGPLAVLKGMFMMTIISLLLIGTLSNLIVFFYIGMIGIAIGYGGFLSIFPTLTNLEFGAYRYGAHYGIMFQAYGFAALSGILLLSISGSYTITFLISAFSGLIGLIVSTTLKKKL